MSSLLKFRTTRRKPPTGLIVRQALDLSSYLPFRVFQLTQNLAFRGKVQVGDSVVSIRDWRILALLAATGLRTNQELAEEIGLDAATVSRAVQHLKHTGLIDLRRSKRDKRMQLVALTQKGADVHDKLAPERKRFSEQVESCLTESERAAMYHAFDKIDAFFAEQRIEHDEWE